MRRLKPTAPLTFMAKKRQVCIKQRTHDTKLACNCQELRLYSMTQLHERQKNKHA